MKYAEYNHNIMVWLKHIFISIFLFIVSILPNISSLDSCEEKFCEPPRPLEPHEPSIFIIHAAGRLGNHLMAFAIVQTLAKTLNIQPFISGETATYLRQYFQPGKIQVLEDHFCNHNALPSIIFNEDLDYLVEHSELHNGKILQLWPWGYKENSPVCCPADELMKYVSKHNLQGVKDSLKFQSKYVDHAQEIKKNVSIEMKMPLEDITFIGVHNRRTDHIAYFKQNFNKRPLKKSYFKDAMEHFREESTTKAIAFLYISDDMEWGRTHLKNVKKKYNDLFFIGIGEERIDAIGYDMAVMSECNHMIMSRGSYSSWCAILAGGEYYTEWGLIVPLNELVNQQEDRQKRRENRKKKSK